MVSHVISPLVSEDNYHPALSINVTVSSAHSFQSSNFLYDNSNALIRLNYKKADLRCYFFVNIGNASFSKFIPPYINRKFSVKRYPPWFDGDIIKDLNIKHKLLRKRNLSSHFHYLQIKELSRSLHNRIKNNYKLYVKSTENKLTAEPKSFWGFVNRGKKECDVQNLMHYDNSILYNPGDILDAFANFFSSYSVCTQNTVDRQSMLVNTSLLVDSNWLLNESQILKAAKSLEGKNTAEPDGIPEFIVKDCATVFAKPLCFIFNNASETGIFSHEWKKAKVRPVFKKVEKNLIRNYRPIAII